MIEFQAGEEFLIAVPRAYREQEVIDLTDAHGLKGRIVEAISHLDYLEVWAFRGFPSEGVSAMRPRFYYRCVKLVSDKPPLTTTNDPNPALRGDQESAG
jgi:hypothetical protein